MSNSVRGGDICHLPLRTYSAEQVAAFLRDNPMDSEIAAVAERLAMNARDRRPEIAPLPFYSICCVDRTAVWAQLSLLDNGGRYDACHDECGENYK